ncbi:S9 family peptidase [Bacteroidota bacterium]
MFRQNITRIFVLLIIGQSILFAQSADPSLLTLERIFTNEEFVPEELDDIKWLEDKSKYTMLESSESVEEAEDIVSYEIESGNREVLVPASMLIPEGKETPLTIDNYYLYESQHLLLIFTNSKKVWRHNTRGDYWILNMDTGSLTQLGKGFPASKLMFATISPDFTNVAYVCLNNLYVENLSDHSITALTKDGSKTIINGTSDWVYEEELRLRNAFRWSPDGKRIAYWQFDAEGVGIFNMINNTDSLYPKLIPIQYPKVGTTNSAVRVGVVDAAGGETTWFKIPGDPRNNYIAWMEWADNSDEVLIQQLNRLQNTNKIILGNADNGYIQIVHVESDKAWLRVVHDLKWYNDGKYFTWRSEKYGWSQIFIISRDGLRQNLITPGEYDVINISLIDDINGWVYFIASPDNPTQRYLFRTKLDGTSSLEKLSPEEQKGTHAYNISPDGKYAFHTFSNSNTPPVTQLISLPGHNTIRVVVDNAELKSKYDKLKIKPVEFFRITIEDGTELDAYKILPYNFDPSKKYPVLFFVYGEPAGQTVLDRWGRNSSLWHQMLAQQGYIIMSVDGRGTPAPRGSEWIKCTYKQVGIVSSADHAAAVGEICKLSYVDATRIGIWGWSGGGSNTLNAILRYPDLYKMGISVAPVPDQRLYDTIYQERYMGLPVDNEEGYRLGSPITFAHQLKGNLLLIHGTGDDNVHYQGTERLMNEFIKHNKMFSLMSYPNRSHSIREGEGTSRHLYETMTLYLMNNL